MCEGLGWVILFSLWCQRTQLDPSERILFVSKPSLCVLLKIWRGDADPKKQRGGAKSPLPCVCVCVCVCVGERERVSEWVCACILCRCALVNICVLSKGQGPKEPRSQGPLTVLALWRRSWLLGRQLAVHVDACHHWQVVDAARLCLCVLCVCVFACICSCVRASVCMCQGEGGWRRAQAMGTKFVRSRREGWKEREESGWRKERNERSGRGGGSRSVCLCVYIYVCTCVCVCVKTYLLRPHSPSLPQSLSPVLHQSFCPSHPRLQPVGGRGCQLREGAWGIEGLRVGMETTSRVGVCGQTRR